MGTATAISPASDRTVDGASGARRAAPSGSNVGGPHHAEDERRPGERSPGRGLQVLIWFCAYAAYLLAYAGAARLGYTADLGSALLVGLMNSLPEALAAPLVLRLARASALPGEGRGRARLALPLLAVAFTAWCILGAALAYAFLRWRETGAWELALDRRTLPWKALLSLLVFALLAGVGMARAYAGAARAAAARAERAETLRAEARLAVLRAQLNPHFILNVLHSLVGLAERDPRLTAAALERLGKTLRYALRVQSRGIDRVTVGEELAFVRDYLELERLRLADRLTVHYDVDEKLLDGVVPSFVLQPLVENAVRHGIAPHAAGGSVWIRVAAPAGELLLSVDDAAAVPRAGAGTAAPGGGGSGVGLQLLRDRLAALHGDRARLRVGRSARGGFCATVELPLGDPETTADR